MASQSQPGVVDRRGREQWLEDSPPARFISQSNIQDYIKTQRPKHESQTTGLLRTPGVFFP
jgi:hypothetical protein